MLPQSLTEHVLEDVAGERAFARGAEYFATGRVTGLKTASSKVVAVVNGTRNYRVKLWDTGNLAFECSCPVGQDGIFCKHCVAVGLAWLAQNKPSGTKHRMPQTRQVSDEEIRSRLMELDSSSLVNFVMEHAAQNSRLRERLVLLTVEKPNSGPDLAAFRAVIDRAISTRHFVDYRRMPSYAAGIDAIIDSLEAQLQRGHASAVRELVERALRHLESAMGQMDDSDGYMRPLIDRLQELHLEACRLERPDPLVLAKFLFQWEISSDWEIFLGAAEDYAEVLGDAGLRAYRRLAEVKWAEVPTLTPGEKDEDGVQSRWRITHMMETLARQSGDAEALVAVKLRDLSAAYRFLEIARIYKAAGDDEAALHWAERGLDAYPSNTDSRLREFLIEEYHRRKRHDAALAIAWEAFREHPTLENYIPLRNSAEQAKRWPEWREKALTFVRELREVESEKFGQNRWQSWQPVAVNSDLVNIYLWEGNADAAWNEAQGGGCTDHLWFRLAEAREADHPEDAILVYNGQLKRALKPADQRAYEEVIEILSRIHCIQERLGRKPEFSALVAAVRMQFKCRRNLMKLLDAKRW